MKQPIVSYKFNIKNYESIQTLQNSEVPTVNVRRHRKGLPTVPASAFSQIPGD